LADPYVHELRVRFGECDPQGIVFNANYLLYIDTAFTELWREAVGRWDDNLALGVDLVVAEANQRFRAPARFDDVIQVRMQVTRLGTTSMTTEFDIYRDEELLIESWLRHVCVDRRTWAKTELPEPIRTGLRRFAADDAERAPEPA
jgi:acyl-CoA thioester hydrolase